MRKRIFLLVLSAILFLFSATVPAHNTEPGALLPHIFTGEHLLILVMVGVCVLVISRFHRRSQ